MSVPGTRRPRRVYGEGSDPDPRFSLANERTALAWVRTALAMVAGGVGLTSAAAVTNLPAIMDVVAAVACVGGGVLGVRAAFGWAAVERALRRGEPLPPPRSLGVLVVVVMALALAVAGYAIAQTTR